MTYPLISILIIIGLSGIIGQVLIMRELLVVFYGNELTLGVILANWILVEALGVFVIGKCIERIKDKFGILVILQIIFSLSLPFVIYLSRIFKNILGIPFAEGIGLQTVFLISFILVLPIAFTHGGLFSLFCRMASSKEPSAVVGRVYAWETVGTVIGGIILTYFFIPNLNSFQVVFIVGFINLLSCLFVVNHSLNRILRYVVILALGLFIIINPNSLHKFSIDKQWNIGRVLDYRNSVYSNIVVLKREKQYTFFTNGIPVINLPYPDFTFTEEFGHLPLLFHQNPKDILVIGKGAGGLLNEILKHPVEKIDYTELDPLLIKMLKEYPTKLTLNEFKDGRVNIINIDARFFLKNTSRKYDVILIGETSPSSLSVNRVFTDEFFSLAKDKLNQSGILAFYLPGSLSYISSQLRDLNSSILNTLRKNFSYIRVIPGDYNLFLASGSDLIHSAAFSFGKLRTLRRRTLSNVEVKPRPFPRSGIPLEKRLLSGIGRGRNMPPSVSILDRPQSLDCGVGGLIKGYGYQAIAQKIKEKDIKVKLLVPAYLEYRLDKKWQEWFYDSLGNTGLKINQDSAPIAVWQALVLWNKQFAPGLTIFFEALNKIDLKLVLIFISALTFLLWGLFYRNKFRKLSLAYSIATTGFTGMLLNMVLLLSFQVAYGYLYYQLGLLISLFMLGIGAGSFLMVYWAQATKKYMRLFILLEIAVIIFTLILGLALSHYIAYIPHLSLFFTAAFIISGFLVGCEFPLATKIYLEKDNLIGEGAGILYFFDLLGSCLASILVGVLFLPLLGLLNTCLIAVGFKISSFIFLFIRWRLAKPT